MKNFWKELRRPFFALAPLEDVTDAAFRQLIARHGKPDVFYTEFTSADGLVLAPEGGRAKLLKKLSFSGAEHPIVAQLFSAKPEHMEAAARMAADLGFDGIDINMGCPDRAIEKGLCGSAMIKHPALAKEIIKAAKRGAGDLPVSVKTRIGYASNEIPIWIPNLLEEGIAALAIHARTRNEMSEVPARWEYVKEVVGIRDSMGVDTLIIGNGDLKSIADAREKVAATGADGAMLGRAIFGNPWLFSEHIPTPSERVEALAEHIQLFDELLRDVSNFATISEKDPDISSSLGRNESKLSSRSSFATMKKHFKAYISGWDGAKDVRMRLMDTNNSLQALAILREVTNL